MKWLEHFCDDRRHQVLTSIRIWARRKENQTVYCTSGCLVIYLLLTKQKFCLHSIFIFLAVNSSLRLAPKHNMLFGRSPSFFVSAKGLCVAISSFRQWVIWTNLGQGERTTTLYNSFGFMIISLI